MIYGTQILWKNYAHSRFVYKFWFKLLLSFPSDDTRFTQKYNTIIKSWNTFKRKRAKVKCRLCNRVYVQNYIAFELKNKVKKKSEKKRKKQKIKTNYWTTKTQSIKRISKNRLYTTINTIENRVTNISKSIVSIEIWLTPSNAKKLIE